MIAGTLQLVRVEVIDNAVGGDDTAYGEAGEDVLVGGTRDDDLDGGLDATWSSATTRRSTAPTTLRDYTNPRFRTLLTGTADLQHGDRPPPAPRRSAPPGSVDPRGAPSGPTTGSRWSTTPQTTPLDRFGSDYIAGGARTT